MSCTRLESPNRSTPTARKLIRTSKGLPWLSPTSSFIDDFPVLGVAGIGKAVLSIFAALLYALNADPQWKEVLPEGDFAQQ
jgi:hypothetical protein